MLVNRQCDSTESTAMLPLFIVSMIPMSRLQQDAMLPVFVVSMIPLSRLQDAMLPVFIVSMIPLSRLQDSMLPVYRQYDYTESFARFPVASVKFGSSEYCFEQQFAQYGNHVCLTNVQHCLFLLRQ